MNCPLSKIEEVIMREHKNFIERNPEHNEIIQKFYDAIIYGLEPTYINCVDNCHKNEGN